MAEQGAERIEYWRPSELAGVEILLVENSNRRWHVFHEAYEICTLLDFSGGEAEWTYRGRLYQGKAGDLMLLEPGEVHANTHVNPPCTFRVAVIDPPVLAAAAAEMGFKGAAPHWRSGRATFSPLFKQFARLHDCLERPSTALERESRFADCLSSALEHCLEARTPPPPSARPALLRARDFIQEHASRPIALQELASVSGLSRFHLVRAFAREFALPPHAYQLHVQIARARHLLTSGMPPAFVAAETGFADQSHLTRHFKTVWGITPGQYVRGVTGGRRLNGSR